MEQELSKQQLSSIEWVERNIKDASSEEIDIKIVENTPFRIAGKVDEKGYIDGCKILVGNQIASYRTFENEEEALGYINAIPWDLVVVVASTIVETELKQIKIKEKGE